MDKEQAKMTVYVLKGMLAEAEPEEQLKVNKAADELRAWVDKNGDEGKVATALVFAGLFAEGAYE